MKYAACFIVLGICALFLQQPVDGNLVVSMLAVGQGDAILIQFPNGQRALIDTGPDRTVNSELGEVLGLRAGLDLLILTHDDTDHIGGAGELQHRYCPTALVRPALWKDAAYTAVVGELVQRCGTEVSFAQAGDSFQFDDAYLYVLSPSLQFPHDETNDNSVIVLLEYKQTKMLFTGDASKNVEREVLQGDRGMLRNIDVLKAGHHGSDTSTSQELLEYSSPAIALISAGIDNTFGHPHAAVLRRLHAADVQLLSTQNDGRIICTSNGQTVRCAH